MNAAWNEVGRKSDFQTCLGRVCVRQVSSSTAGCKMSTPQKPPSGDWRAGGYRDAYERVPRPPRKPTPFAHDLIYGYQGSQGASRTIGLVFLAIGLPLILFLGDGVMTDLALSISGRSTTATVLSTRVVTSVEINDRHPVEIKYRYEVDGVQHEAASYTTRSDVSSTAFVGASIAIETVPSLPSWSRVTGTTSSKMGTFVLFFLIFPAVGAGLVLSAVRSNRREIHAFRHGTATKGLVKRRGFDQTTEVNGKNPYEVTWEFQVDGATYTGKLSHMDPALLSRALPEDEVTVLYDPKDPKINTVWFE